MKLTCPVCGFYSAIEGFLMVEDHKKALHTLLTLPEPLPRLAVSYLGLFRKPGSDRAMTAARAVRLSCEISELVNAPNIQWKGGRILPNKAKFWAEAIQIIFDKDQNQNLKRPLTNHNLLRCIAYELAEKAFEAGIKEKENQLQYRPISCEESGLTLEEAREIAKRNLKKWKERNESSDCR